jgi:trk system potassium uptake protein
MKMRVLIVGGNPTGSQLASLLLAQKFEVCLIEHHPEVLKQLHLELPTEVIYEDNPGDLKVLELAGIREADVLVACTSDDATNLVLCYLAHTLYHVSRTIGCINNPRHAWLFNAKLHVDVALNEASILAHLIEEEMSLGDMMTLLKLHRGQYTLVEVIIAPGAKASGTFIKDLSLPDHCVIVAIIRKGEMIVPRGGTAIEVGDEVIIITDRAGEKHLVELFTLQNSKESP